MKCPNCNLVNIESALRCDCGFDFESKTIKGSYVAKKNNSFELTIIKKIFFSAIITLSFFLIGIILSTILNDGFALLTFPIYSIQSKLALFVGPTSLFVVAIIVFRIKKLSVPSVAILSYFIYLILMVGNIIIRAHIYGAP
jgi:hypothetical protein